MRLRNVVASTPVVCETNRKQFHDFRGVRIKISAVFRLWWPHFFNRSAPNPCTNKIQQCRVCVQWWM